MLLCASAARFTFRFYYGTFDHLGAFLNHALSLSLFGRSALALKLQQRNKSSA